MTTDDHHTWNDSYEALTDLLSKVIPSVGDITPFPSGGMEALATCMPHILWIKDRRGREERRIQESPEDLENLFQIFLTTTR